MPTARKLPSGSYRVRVFDYKDEDGAKHYRSFTARTKKEAERLAAEWTLDRDESYNSLSFRMATEMYIAQRSSILSPSTIKEYKSMCGRYMAALMPKSINAIKQTDIQREVNRLAASGLSPKTIRNVHGFISAVMAAYRPDFVLHTELPKKVPPKLYIPSDAEIKRLMDEVSGTVMELPVLLAAFGPMQRGEICALRAENIDGNVVHVCEAMVQDENKQWVIKAPKTYAGDRYIDYPDFVAEKWQDIESAT